MLWVGGYTMNTPDAHGHSRRDQAVPLRCKFDVSDLDYRPIIEAVLICL